VRVLVCGEFYSDNLGDGVIALGMSQLVRLVEPQAVITLFDISGRTAFDTSPASAGNPLRRVLQAVHRGIYSRSRWDAGTVNHLRHRFSARIASRYRALDAEIADCDQVLIGGGQLLQDNRLMFPLAISTVVATAARHGRPVAFFGVGASDRWSPRGRHLVARALAAPCVTRIVCRDELSAARVRERFPTVAARVRSSYDVALATQVEAAWRRRRRTDTVGLNLMHPDTIRWTVAGHGMERGTNAVHFWVRLLQALHAARIPAELFTNGSMADEEFVDVVLTQLERRAPGVPSPRRAPRSRTPADLIRTIDGFGAIVAHRLHANIVATILGVPSVALEWDAKVEEFMKYSGQADCFVRDGTDVGQVVTRVAALLAVAPTERARLQPLLERLSADLRSVLDEVSARISVDVAAGGRATTDGEERE